MTDTFANGPSAPGGATPNTSQQAGDVTGTLAELERKLRELEQELSSIGRRRALTGAPYAQDAVTGSPAQASGRLVDEAIEPPVSPAPSLSSVPHEPPAGPAPAVSSLSSEPLAPAASRLSSEPTAPAVSPLSSEPPAPAVSWLSPELPTPTAPAVSSLSPEPPVSPAPALSPVPPQPAAPLASAAPIEPAGAGQPVKFMRPHEPPRASGSREPGPGSETLAGSEPSGESEPQWTPAQQERPRPSEAQLASLAELRRFRDRLERFARDLADEYDALLGRVMSGLTSAPPPAASPTPRATPPDSGSAAPAVSAPSASTISAPLAAAPPVAPPPPESAPESPEDALFEGRVELGVGPFYDIVSLSAFERRLASLPYVVEASVRRFEASHAVVDLRLAAPVALVRELRRTAETDFSVREVADGRILLTFDET